MLDWQVLSYSFPSKEVIKLLNRRIRFSRLRTSSFLVLFNADKYVAKVTERKCSVPLVFPLLLLYRWVSPRWFRHNAIVLLSMVNWRHWRSWGSLYEYLRTESDPVLYVSNQSFELTALSRQKNGIVCSLFLLADMLCMEEQVSLYACLYFWGFLQALTCSGKLPALLRLDMVMMGVSMVVWRRVDLRHDFAEFLACNACLTTGTIGELENQDVIGVYRNSNPECRGHLVKQDTCSRPFSRFSSTKRNALYDR